MRVLITGASSGIGEQLAYNFAKEGFDLLLVARRESLLNKIKGNIAEKYQVDCDCYACDITSQADELFGYCKDRKYDISVLINNAGFGDYGEFTDSDIDKDIRMIELNNTALVKLTYLFVKEMKTKGNGYIINTGSVASFVPGPYMAVYYASKAFVMSFSMALREELKKDNIKVSVLCPAPTKSDFWKVANGETNSAYNNIFARTPEDAARTAMKMFKRNKPYSIDGLVYKLAIPYARHLPFSLSSSIIGKVQSLTKKKKQ